jgi:hypothetical protein
MSRVLKLAGSTHLHTGMPATSQVSAVPRGRPLNCGRHISTDFQSGCGQALEIVRNRVYFPSHGAWRRPSRRQSFLVDPVGPGRSAPARPPLHRTLAMVECRVRHSQYARIGSSAAERSSTEECVEHLSSFPIGPTTTILALGSCWLYRPTCNASGSPWRQPPRRRIPCSQIRRGTGRAGEGATRFREQAERCLAPRQVRRKIRRAAGRGREAIRSDAPKNLWAPAIWRALPARCGAREGCELLAPRPTSRGTLRLGEPPCVISPIPLWAHRQGRANVRAVRTVASLMEVRMHTTKNMTLSST